MFEKWYRILNKEIGDRICTGITDEACAYTPRNYFLIIFTNILTKLGDVLSAPKTVVTWLMGYIGAPVFLISLLVPIRESGSMLPQVFMSHALRHARVRKKWWVMGSLMQAISLFVIAFVTLFVPLVYVPVIIVICIGIFALGRSLCSLTSKDVIGKTIPKTRRGKLGGYSNSLSGFLVLISGLILLLYPLENADLNILVWLIGIAGILWIITAGVFAQVKEFQSEVPPTQQAQTIFGFIHILKNDRILQKFILARGLLISSALLSPFIVLLSQQNIGTNNYILGMFILSGGLASIISGPFWGHMADRSSKMVMVKAASIVAILSSVLMVFIFFELNIVYSVWMYPIVFFILGIAHDGIRLGRKTYIIDIAEGEERTRYVAISNTAIGILLLFVGLFTAWLGSLSLLLAIAILTIMVLLGIWFSWRLPEVR